MNHRAFEPPLPHSIHRGTITRIEPFGAFVKLHSSPISGLVHISQLHSSKIQNVTDVVDLEMGVYVKVMEVTVDSYQDENTGRERTRHRVKLSMKYVDQETGRDLDPENVEMEQDLFRRSGTNNNNSSGNRGDGGADSNLGRALTSNIGMGSAMDPGNLVLKGKVKGGASFNGYALVGDEEGEAEAPQQNNLNINAQAPQREAVKPLGRGRGTTLPAWMTRQDDKLGTMSTNNKHNSDVSDGSRDESRRKSSKHSKKKHKHHKRHKHKDRRRDRSRSSSRERKRSKKSHKRRHRSRSRSLSRDRHDRPKDSEFASVEEAKAVIERLERRRRER